MATLPNTYARRPTPRFGGAETAAPIVESGDIALGQGIQALGKGMGDYLIRAKAKQDQIALEDYTTRAKAKALELRREYEQKKGADAAQDDMFFSGTMEKFEGVRKELLSEVKDADVHKALEQRLELAGINFQEGLIKHITTEGEVYGDQVYESGVGLAQEDMGANYMDDSQLLQARNDIERNTQIYAQRKGIPLNSPVYKKMLLDNLTQGHVNVIKALVEDGNISAAKDYFKDFKKKEISGDLHDNIDKLIKSAGVKEMSIQYTQDLFARRPDGMTEAEFMRWGTDWIRNNVESQYHDETLTRFKARVGEKEAIDNQIKADFADDAYRIFNERVEAGDSPMDAFEAIPQSIIDSMDQKTVTAMRNMAEKRAQNLTIHTDPTTFLDLYEMATGTPEQKALFRDKTKTNLRDYVDRLSTAHVAFFAKLQDDIDEQAIASTMADLKKDIGMSAGYYNKKTGKQKDADAIFELNQRFDEELLALQKETGQKATTAEARQIADRLKIKILRERSMTNWFADRSIAGTAEIEGVPREMVDELAYALIEAKRKLKAEGKDVDDQMVTEREIKEYYEWTLRGGSSPGKAPASTSTDSVWQAQTQRRYPRVQQP